MLEKAGQGDTTFSISSQERLHLFQERALHIHPADFAKSRHIFPKKVGRVCTGIERGTSRSKVFGSPLSCYQ